MRRPKLIPLLATLVALAAAAPASAAELGLNVNGGAAAGTEENYRDLDTLDAKWARHFLDWDNLDWDNHLGPIYGEMVRRENALGVKTLITVKSGGNTPPPNHAEFARRMEQLATIPGLEAIEIWNEADLEGGLFWAGGPDLRGYVNLLKASYPAIKAGARRANQDVTVVFSPTVGNNFGWVEAAYREGAGGHFDAMAVHTDTACLDRAPTSYYREQDGRIGRFTFLGYREVHNVMRANGDGHKPIWMTEFGWSAAAAIRCDSADKPGGVSEADQARYLLDAVNCLARDPYVQVAMWYNSRDLKAPDHWSHMYGLRRLDGSERPAYAAFRTAATRPADASAPCGDFEGPTPQPLDPKPGFVLAPGSTMTIRAKADAPDLNKVFFRVEGPGAAPLFSGTNNNAITLNECGGGVCERVWGGARDLGNGQHKLLIWAVDNNGTSGPVTEIPFSKGVPYQGPGGTDGPGGAASFVKFPKLRLTGKGLKRTFRGGSLPGITSGAVRIEWYLKTKVKNKKGKKKTKWVRYHGKAVMARSPFMVKQKLRRHGKWRVRALYLGTTGIPETPSCWTEFKTRSKKKKLVCPKGAVRPTDELAG